MRNLKRALSLALASVMVMGLMVAGSSAKGYDDVTSEENVEAIEVLQAVGIMTGDDNGNFNPTQNVTRNEMAVIMSNLMDYRVATYKGTSPFTDVPEWAEPYVAACYTNGIIAGYSATTFGGSDPVVTSQATLMILKALGYFKYSSDFGDDWQLATINQANKVDLLVDVDSAVRVPMTRNDVAQLVLNGLEAGTVEPDVGNKLDINIGGTQITSGTKYNFITSGQKYAFAINKALDTNNNGEYSKGSIVELGEKLYQGDLTLKDDLDAFGRPANHWEYLGKEVGTYAESADYTWSKKVTSKTLYNAVGSAACDYEWTVSFNGEEQTYTGAQLKDPKNRVDDDKDFYNRATGNSALTGNGVVTEVFVDGTGDGSVHVAIYELYAAEVLKVIEDDGTITLSDLNDGPAKASHDFETTAFEEDDIVVYTFSEKSDTIQTVKAAERIEGEITRVRTGTNAGTEEEGLGDKFTVDGTTYEYNKTSDTDNHLQTENVNNNMVGYLDEFGYCIWVDETAISYDYAYVLSAGTEGDKYGDKKGETVYARLALTDGTMISVETDAKASEAKDLKDTIVAYSKDSKNVYTLTPVYDIKAKPAKAQAAPDLDINNNVSSFDVADGVRYSATSKTIFVIVETDPDSFNSYNYTVYTGIKNVPDIDGREDTTVAVATEKDSRVAKVVYIMDSDLSGTDVFFVRADRNAKLVKDSSIGNYYEINAYVDGEAVTLQVKENSSAADVLVDDAKKHGGISLDDNKSIFAVRSITKNDDDLVTGVRAYDAYVAKDGDGTIQGVGTDKTTNGNIILGSDGRFTASEDAVFVQYNNRNNKNAFIDSRASAIKNDANDQYVAILDGDVIIGICVWYKEGGEGEFEVPGEKEINLTVNFSGMTVKLNDKAIATGVAEKVTGNVTLEVSGLASGKVAAFTVDGTDYTLKNGESKTFTFAADTTITMTAENEASTYQWIAPAGTVYSVDGGKTWNKKVECDGKQDTVVLIKPEETGFFFTATPTTSAPLAGITPTASTTVDGAYEIKLTADVNDPVGSSAVTATIAKATHVGFNTDDDEVAIRFVDASGDQDTVTMTDAVAKAKIAKEMLDKISGYSVSDINSDGDIKIIVNGVTHTVAAASITGDGVLAYVGADKTEVVVSSTKKVDDLTTWTASTDVRQTEEDGTVTVIQSANLATAPIVDSATYVEIAKPVATPSGTTSQGSVTATYSDGKGTATLPSTPVDDMNGALGSVNTDYTHALSIPSKRVAIMTVNFPTAADLGLDPSDYVMIVQTNSGLEASKNDTNRISKINGQWVKKGSAIQVSSLPAADTIVVTDDGQPIVLEFYKCTGAGTAGESGTPTGSALVTLTVSTSGVVFK